MIMIIINSVIFVIVMMNSHPAQSPESSLSKSRRSGRCLVMLISVMMRFVFSIVVIIKIMIIMIIMIIIMVMPMNESAECSTIFPRVAHVHHMDSRVALF